MAREKKRFSSEIQIKNRRARYEYEFLDHFNAGLVLTGTEIKAIREGKANLQDGYCYFKGKELWVKQVHIAHYQEATRFNHDPTRERKLLLNKKELAKLMKASQEKGAAIIPIRLFINKRGLAKLEIVLAKGKKHFDKRTDLKEKDLKREIEQHR